MSNCFGQGFGSKVLQRECRSPADQGSQAAVSVPWCHECISNLCMSSLQHQCNLPPGALYNFAAIGSVGNAAPDV